MSEHEQQSDRDRVIANTGWGVKPDDQPANAGQVGGHATCRYEPGDPQAVRSILIAQRRGFNTATRVRIEPGRTTIIDINKDAFVIEGLSFGDENLTVLLRQLGAAFNPQELRQLGPEAEAVREFELSRVWAWGAERTG